MIPFLPNLEHSSKVTLLSSSLSYFIKKQSRLLFLVLILTSCATSLKDASSTAIESERIRQALDTLTALYEKKETSFFSHLHPLFKWPAFFKESVQHDFETVSEINMTIKITRLEITKEAVFTSIYWEGTWKDETPPVTVSLTLPLRQSGNALFIFSTASPPLLMEIRGESPFGVFQKK